MNSRVRNASTLFMLALWALVIALPCGAATKQGRDEGRAEVRNMAHETLARLYQVKPGAKAALEAAAGYAVFSNFGMKMFIVGGGKGMGLAVNNANKKVAFMRMSQLEAGSSPAIGKLRLIWAFETKKAFDRFVHSGWELGAQANAAGQPAMQAAAFEGAVSIAPGVWLYQLGDDGLALELAVKGTKYLKDKDLN